MAGLRDEMAAISEQRARLDDRELALIDRARRDGATWAELAAALGLASRQAAEQRRQRLAAAVDRAASSRRHHLDLRYGDPIATLRTAVVQLCHAIDADPHWPHRFVRAPLVRDTLTTAATADPGPLFALAAQAATDLGQSGVDRWPPDLATAVGQLGRALRQAIPLSTDH